MTKFVLWRVAQLPLILAIIYVITFLLAWAAPGSPFDRPDRKLDPIAEKQLREQFHADHWYKFLAYYPLQMIRGDLGPSMEYKGWSVNDVLRDSLPISITLGLFAMAIALMLGSFIGALAAVRRGGAFDYTSLIAALAGISLPGFVVAGLLDRRFLRQTRLVPQRRLGRHAAT